MALNFPSNTSSPYTDPVSGVKYIFNTAIGAWESAIQPPAIVSASAPSLAIEGFVWWDTTNSQLKVYHNGAWVAANSSTSTQVDVSATPPGGAGNGSLWWDSESGTMFVYYTDADSSQWIPASGNGGILNGGGVKISSSSPLLSDSVDGDIWYNTLNNQLYVFNSGSWNVTQTTATGVNSLTAGTYVNLGGTSTDPVVNVQNSSTTVRGAIQTASQAVVNAATDTDQAITPSTLASGISNYLPDATDTSKGVVELATSSEVSTGTDTTRAITPAALNAAIPNLGITAPTGTIITFAGTSAPTGYLECDGAAVDRTTYSALFAICGTTYGSGDGSTTFNLPDLRGEFVRGWDNSRGVDSGRSFGSTQNSANLSHSHNITDPGHTHPIEASTADASVATGGASAADSATTTNTTSATTNITIQNSGDSEARPRNIALLYCVKS